MGAMLGISLYSYPYLNWQKCFVFLIIVYTLSSTKLNKGRTVPAWKRGGRGGEGGGGEKWAKHCMHI
jgi:hypothetical protein